MKLKKSTIVELKQILKEEFNFHPGDKDLSKLAYSLVGYFDLLMRAENRHRFGNRSDRAIDSNRDSVLDKEEVK